MERENLRKRGLDPGDDSISQMPNLILSKQNAAVATA